MQKGGPSGAAKKNYTHQIRTPSMTASKLLPSSSTQYWTTSHHLQPTPRLDPAAASLVDWDATGALTKALPAGKRRWCTKHGSENSGGLGVTAQIWRIQDDDSKCPCCDSPDDSTHVLRCMAAAPSAAWAEHMEALRQSLEDTDCCPILCSVICYLPMPQ
jgi:hypothetical protein